jgi:hypothetical protein
MSLLLFSLLPLFAGPLVVRLLQSARGVAGGVDGFVVVSIAGLVSLHVLPEAVGEGGGLAVAAMAVGLLVPDFGGRLFARGRGLLHHVTFAIGILALALHATLDGVALAGHHDHGGDGHDSVLGLAVVLHRIPVGLAIWWLVRPRLGSKVAWAAVVAIAASTLIGFGWAATSEDAFSSGGWAVFQAFVAGSLLHVVIGHVTPSVEHEGAWRPASAVGGLLAGVCVTLLEAAPHEGHDHGDAHAAEALWALTSQSAWSALLAVGIVSAAWWLWRALPASSRLLHSTPDNRTLGERLLSTGAWFLVATAQNRREQGHHIARCAVFRAFPPSSVAPALGAAALVLSFWLLEPQVAALRVGVTTLAAVVLIGWRRLYRPAQSGVASCSCGHSAAPVEEGESWLGKLAAFQDALVPRVVFGLLFAALVQTLLDPGRVHELGALGQVAVLAGLGSMFSICAVGSLPVMAVLLHKGFCLGALMAFFYASAAASLYLSWFRSPLTRRMVVMLVAQTALAVVLGWLFVLFMPDHVDVHLHHGHGHHESADCHGAHGGLDLVATVGALGLAALLVLSLFRMGVEGFLSEGVPLSLGGHHHHWGAQSHESDHSSEAHPPDHSDPLSQ